jgi:hypothetical protein
MGASSRWASTQAHLLWCLHELSLCGVHDLHHSSHSWGHQRRCSSCTTVLRLSQSRALSAAHQSGCVWQHVAVVHAVLSVFVFVAASCLHVDSALCGTDGLLTSARWPMWGVVLGAQGAHQGRVLQTLLQCCVLQCTPPVLRMNGVRVTNPMLLFSVVSHVRTSRVQNGADCCWLLAVGVRQRKCVRCLYAHVLAASAGLVVAADVCRSRTSDAVSCMLQRTGACTCLVTKVCQHANS